MLQEPMENARRSRRLRHETPEMGLLHPLESPGTQWVSLLDPAISAMTDAMKALHCKKDSSRPDSRARPTSDLRPTEVTGVQAAISV